MNILITLLAIVTLQLNAGTAAQADNPCTLNPVRVSACHPEMYPVGTSVAFSGGPIFGYDGGTVTGYYLEPDSGAWVYTVMLPGSHEHFTNGVVAR